MGITFNNNLSALSAQRYLGIAGDKTSSSLAKLSSGSRVPTAKDDAAALAVGSKLKAEVAGLTQASNNAAQAGTLLQIADGALSTTGDILQRLKVLAVQSSSGQLSNSERSLLNQEYVNLRSEVDRIAQVTNFNGNTLLNGGDVTAALSEAVAGFAEGRGVNLSFDTAKTPADSVFRLSYDFTDNTTNGNTTDETDTANLTIVNLTTGESQTVDLSSFIRGVTGEARDTVGEGAVGDTTLNTNLTGSQTAQVNFSALGVTVTLDNRFVNNADFTTAPAATITAPTASTLSGTAAATWQVSSGTTGANFAAVLAGADYSASTGLLGIQVDTTATANSLNFAATAGVQFSTNGGGSWATSANGVASNTAGNGILIRFGGAGGATMRLDLSAVTSTTTTSTNATINVDLRGLFRAQESASAAKSFDFKVGTGTTTNDNIAFTLSAATTSALNINGSTIDTVTTATDAITRVNDAISTVASRRADVGANQSRLDFAGAAVAVAIENTTAAQSALLDVDVSSEITQFTSQQVLLQAGISLLAQANQQPSLLLRLLQ